MLHRTAVLVVITTAATLVSAQDTLTDIEVAPIYSLHKLASEWTITEVNCEDGSRKQIVPSSDNPGRRVQQSLMRSAHGTYLFAPYWSAQPRFTPQKNNATGKFKLFSKTYYYFYRPTMASLHTVVDRETLAEDGTLTFDVIDTLIDPKEKNLLTLRITRNLNNDMWKAESTGTSSSSDTNHCVSRISEAKYFTEDDPDQSLLSVAVTDTASLLVTDKDGKRSGFDATSKTELSEISNAVYTQDIMVGSDSTKRPSEVFLNIYEPVDGSYRVVVNGQKVGPFTLEVKGLGVDGNGDPQSFSGSVAPGSSATSIIQYRKATGATVVTQVVADLNGDGVVNCTDFRIVRASLRKPTGQTRIDGRADTNEDGVIDGEIWNLCLKSCLPEPFANDDWIFGPREGQDLP